MANRCQVTGRVQDLVRMLPFHIKEIIVGLNQIFKLKILASDENRWVKLKVSTEEIKY